MVTLAVALVLAAFAAGCDSVTAGGWIVSYADSDEKATFGLSAKCKTTFVGGEPFAVFHDGELEYRDDAADVHVHGDFEANEVTPSPIAPPFPGTCKDVAAVVDTVIPLGPATLQGTYRSQSDDREGTFVIELEDNGEPGASSGDRFEITLAGGINYHNEGPVQGGNIQVR